MTAPLPPAVRAALDRPVLAELWQRAAARLETTGLQPIGKIEVRIPDRQTAAELGALIGRDLTRFAGGKARVGLADLDTVLRAGAAGRGLAEVAAAITGRTLVSRPAKKTAKQDAENAAAGTLTAALAARGLDAAPWVESWLKELRRHGQLTRLTKEPDPGRLARRAAAVAAQLHLDPATVPTATIDRGDLASRHAGGAHSLDDDQVLTNLVLRMVAAAHGTALPAGARERRELWARCGVSVDEISSTVITWALPILGGDAWAVAIRARTEVGLESHITRRELRKARPDAGQRLVAAGTVVAVCENPRVLAACADAGIAQPMVCTFGMPTTLAMDLLTRLAADGARIRYHGDFDAAGILIAALVLGVPGSEPWRMSAGDYEAAIGSAGAAGTELPAFEETPGDAPWDPDLGPSMRRLGLAVEEEVLIATLLADLTDWSANRDDAPTAPTEPS